MADTKPTKPSSTLPNTWGGTHTPYTSSEISSGYEDNIPQIIDGGNINYSLQGIFERLNYLTILADIINATPIGKSLTVDNNNRFDYFTPAVDDSVVHKIGAEEVSGNKTFSGSNTFTGSVSLNGTLSASQSVKQSIVRWGVPDYNSGVSITSPYTPFVDGIIIAQRTAGYSTSQIEVTGGNIIARHQSADSSSSNNYVIAIVKAGQSYTITAGSMVFYPFIGV